MIHGTEAANQQERGLGEMNRNVRGCNMLEDACISSRRTPLFACDQPAQDRGRRTDGNTQHHGSEQDLITLISANVHALGPRLEEVIAWDADLMFLQETKLAPHAIKDATGVAREAGWAFIHGKPCKTAPRTGGNQTDQRTKAPTEASSGGVAALVKEPRKPLQHPMTDQENALHDREGGAERRQPRAEVKDA